MSVHMSLCLTDGEDILWPLLAGISELPHESSTAVGDDPFSRFISLRNSAATADSNMALSDNTSLPGQSHYARIAAVDLCSICLLMQSALLSPANSVFHVRRQTTETAVLPFTDQSCGTVFQPNSVCWTFHCQCSGND